MRNSKESPLETSNFQNPLRELKLGSVRSIVLANGGAHEPVVIIHGLVLCNEFKTVPNRVKLF